MCRMGIPDYLLAFRKPGENPKPIRHPRGLEMYYGGRSIPTHLDRAIAAHQEDHGNEVVDEDEPERDGLVGIHVALPRGVGPGDGEHELKDVTPVRLIREAGNV